jgi:hypothetical protein
LQVAEEAKQKEDDLAGNGRCNRLFYFAIPPSVFAQAAATVRAGGFVSDTKASGGWSARAPRLLPRCGMLDRAS